MGQLGQLVSQDGDWIVRCLRRCRCGAPAAQPPVGGGFDLGVRDGRRPGTNADQEGAMSTATPEPDDDRYPDSWRPVGASPFKPETR